MLPPADYRVFVGLEAESAAELDAIDAELGHLDVQLWDVANVPARADLDPEIEPAAAQIGEHGPDDSWVADAMVAADLTDTFVISSTAELPAEAWQDVPPPYEEPRDPSEFVPPEPPPEFLMP